jgi:hypothetical protein
MSEIILVSSLGIGILYENIRGRLPCEEEKGERERERDYLFKAAISAK